MKGCEGLTRTRKKWIPILLVMLAGMGKVYSDETSKSTEAKNVVKITGLQAFAMWKEGGTVIIDAHSRSGFQRQHVLGAVNVPWDEAEKIEVKLPAQYRLVVYCR